MGGAPPKMSGTFSKTEGAFSKMGGALSRGNGASAKVPAFVYRRSWLLSADGPGVVSKFQRRSRIPMSSANSGAFGEHWRHRRGIPASSVDSVAASSTSLSSQTEMEDKEYRASKV